MYFGYGYGFSGMIYLLPAMLFTLWAQMRVKGLFNKYSKVRNHRNMTGAEAARRVLDANGLSNVGIRRISGDPD